MSDLTERMDALIEEVQNDPDHEKRMFSKTFWRTKLKIKKKTQKTLKHVKQYLIHHGITVRPEYNEFGSAKEEEWLTLHYWDVPSPDDAWFYDMSTKVFENEQEVNVFFLTPLFKALGYQEEDFTFEYKVDIARQLLGMLPRGQRKKFVDLALFDGADRADPKMLVICEAKTPKTPNSISSSRNLIVAEKCLKVYRIGCSTAKRFVATNGDTVKVFTAGAVDLVDRFEVHRNVFKDHWPGLYLHLGKPILVRELEG